MRIGALKYAAAVALLLSVNTVQADDNFLQDANEFFNNLGDQI